MTRPLLTAAECRALAALWDDGARFRRHIDMARHRFGEGEYRYFATPLPPVVADPDRAVLERDEPRRQQDRARLPGDPGAEAQRVRALEDAAEPLVRAVRSDGSRPSKRMRPIRSIFGNTTSR